MAPTLRNHRVEPGHNGMDEHIVAHSLRADGFDASEDGTGRGTPLVAAPLTANYGKQPDNSDATPPNLVAYQCHGSNVGPMGTVRAGNGNETGGVPFVPVAFSGAFSNQGIEQDMSPTLAGRPMASSTQTGVRRLTPRECERLQGFPDDYTLIRLSRQQQRAVEDEMVEYYLRTGQRWAVEDMRHLSADGPRYKALGNSMAVPVMRWIGERIAAVEGIK